MGGASVATRWDAVVYLFRVDCPAVAPWFWIVLSIYLLGVLGYSGYMLAVRYRAPREGRDSGT